MNLKCLIVDDEMHMRENLRNLGEWEKLNIEIIGEAEDGLQALQTIITCQPDIILLDMKIPGYNGVELMRQLGSLRLSPKIIIISGFDDFAYMREGIRNGVIDYILKPIVGDELNSALRKASGQLQQEKLEFGLERIRELHTEVKMNKTDTMAEIYQYIIMNFPYSVSLQTISENFHLNKEFLSRQFKKKYNIGITEFINQNRVCKAKELLQLGYSISDVAERVGYADSNYFSKQFKKHFHLTPTDFAALNR